MYPYELGHGDGAAGSETFQFGTLLLCRDGKRAATWQFRERGREEAEEEVQSHRIGHKVFQRCLWDGWLVRDAFCSHRLPSRGNFGLTRLIFCVRFCAEEGQFSITMAPRSQELP